MQRNSIDNPCFISLIIPAYNERDRIIPTLESAFHYFSGKNFSYEIIVVDDGSRDETAKICTATFSGKENFMVVRIPVNRGKGHAVKSGIENATGEYILFADADNSTPVDELEKFLPYFSPTRILIGSRFLQPELVEHRQPWYRIAISRLANFLIRAFLVRRIHDTQCGFKVFHRGIATFLINRQHIDRFGFDIEYLTIAQSNAIEIREIPVRWINSRDSRLRPVRDTLQTLADFFKIKLYLWRKEYTGT